ncbi:MAG: protein-disulfide reductase DsbD family protein [Proteobacteria bacterium]|nr:protein-disulfide reductase DsbD family protein [Pseudomonadota bacterium]
MASAILGSAIVASSVIAADRNNGGTSGWTQTEYGAVRIVPAHTGLDAIGEARIGVQMRLATGWKTYWRSPGETGVPTQFDWTGSGNLKSATVEWPAPNRFSDFEMETYGYEKEVIFPVRVKAGRPGEPVDLQLALTYGVCKDICIPMDLNLALHVSADPDPKKTRYARDIVKFEKRVPGMNGTSGLTIDRVVVEQGYVLSQVEIYARSDTRFSWPDAAVEMPAGYRMGIPTVNMSTDRKRVNLRMPLWSGVDPEPLEGYTVTVTLWDEDGRSVEHTLEIERRASSVESRLD